MGVSAHALSPVPTFSWWHLGTNIWGDSGNWLYGVVPNFPTAVVIFSTKDPSPPDVSLAGGTYQLGTLDFYNQTAMGYTFRNGTLVIGSGGRINIDNQAGPKDLFDNVNLSLSGPTTLNVVAGGFFTMNETSAFVGSGRLTITGAGRSVFAGNNTYSGGTTISGGTLQVGVGGTSGTAGTGPITNNSVLSFFRSDDLVLSQQISGTGLVEQGGSGKLVFAVDQTYTGPTSIANGALQLGNGSTGGAMGGGTITIGAGASLILNRSGTASMTNAISGSGTLNQIGSAATTLSGNSSAFTGTTNVDAGSLLVTGSLGGTVNINAGALLGGTGTVGSAGLTTTIATGAQLSPGLSPGTLTVAGNLSIAAGSTSIFELRTPGVAGGAGAGANDLVIVGGNLSIANGAILNVNASVSGIYRLFNVGGTITPGGGANLGFTTINITGGTYTASVFQTAGAPNGVNLLLSSGGQIVQAFDGIDFTGVAAGAQGGAGPWNGAGTNWAQDPSGILNDRWWGQVGVFGGATGGAVTVAGPLDFQGLQFSTNGYSLSGGSINATGNSAANARASFLNIDAGVTTTIGSGVTSAAGVGIDKLGRGTLVLTGANSYSGLTDIQAGVVEIRNGAALGTADGTEATGTRVRPGAALAISGGVTAANEALFLGGGGVADDGALRSLSGSNAWNGPIQLEAASRINTDGGTLTLGGVIAGAGRNLTIGGAGTTVVTGAIATGTGGLTHDGSGTLTLGGINSFTGLTLNARGMLVNTGVLAGTVRNEAALDNGGTIGGGLVNTALATNGAGGTIHQGTTNGGTFTNWGTVNGGLLNTATAASLGAGAAAAPAPESGILDNAGTINGGLVNAAKATNRATGIINQGVTNGGTFENAGTVSGGLVNQARASNLAGGIIHQGVTNLALLDHAGTIHGGLTNEGLVQATGTLNGSVANRSTGVFVLSGALSGAMPLFDNAGAVSINAGDLTGVTAFTNSGLLAASHGGSRTLGAATFTNGATGLVSQVNGKASDVLAITGDFVGVAGSRIQQEINLGLPRGEAVNGDQIVVSGAASGATAFSFAPTSTSRAAFGQPIPVFTTGGENKLAANEGRLTELGQGFFDYFLRRSPSRNGFEIVSFYNSGPAAGVASSLASLTSSQQASFRQSFSSIVPRATDCRSNQFVGGPFIRVSAGDMTTKADSAGDMAGGGLSFSSSTRFSSSLRGFQTGFDLGLCNVGGSGWNIHAGVMGGVADISANGLSRAPTPVSGLEISTRTRATANVPFVGIYSFATNGAFTAELDVRRDFYDVKLSSNDAATGLVFVSPNQKLKGDGLSFNGSLSYRWAIGERFHVEPQVGLSKARSSFGLVPFATGSQDFMRIDPLMSLMGRVGLSAGATLPVAEKLVLGPFVSGSLWHEFAKPTRSQTSIGSSGQSFLAETQRVGTFGQVGAGLTISHNDGLLSGYVRGDLRFGERLAGKALNAGLKLSF